MQYRRDISDVLLAHLFSRGENILSILNCKLSNDDYFLLVGLRHTCTHFLKSFQRLKWTLTKMHTTFSGLGILCDAQSAAVHTAVLLPRWSFPHGILLLWDFSAVNFSKSKSILSKLCEWNSITSDSMVTTLGTFNDFTPIHFYY